jgi:hypothetical protein
VLWEVMENYYVSFTIKFLEISFDKDASFDRYSRSVFSILDLAGNLGGINEILRISGGLIVCYLSKDLFLYSLLSKLYQVNQPDPEKTIHENSKTENLEIIDIDEGDVGNSNTEIKPTLTTSYGKVRIPFLVFRSPQNLNPLQIKMTNPYRREAYFQD